MKPSLWITQAMFSNAPHGCCSVCWSFLKRIPAEFPAVVSRSFPPALFQTELNFHETCWWNQNQNEHVSLFQICHVFMQCYLMFFFFKLLYFIFIYITHKIFSLAKSFEFLPTPQRTWQLFPSVKIFCYYARFWLKKSFRWQETRDMSQKVTSLMNLTFSCIDEFVKSGIQIHTFALY